MGPKKQTKRGASKPDGRTTKRAKTKATEATQPVSIKDHVVGRKSNKLTDFFVSSSQNKNNTEPKPKPTKVGAKRGRKPKNAQIKPTPNAAPEPNRERTPPNSFEQLQQEMDALGRQSVYLHDLPEPITRKPQSTDKKNGANNGSRATKGNKPRAKAAESIPAPRYTNFTSDPEEDDSAYIEQVSHHTIELQDENMSSSKQPVTGSRRRSSYLQRGRRMLSIGSGFDINPHDDIPPTDYYKMLGPSLTAAEKMKKLLVWCIRASMDRKEKQTSQTSEEKTVFNIARVVTEEILKGLIDDDISVEWRGAHYQHNSSSEAANGAFIVPNPHNVENRANIEKYRAKLAEVKREKAQLMRSYNAALKQVESECRLETQSQTIDLNNDVNLRIPKEALNGSTVDKLDSSKQNLHAAIAEFQNDSVGQLSSVSYQMKSASALAGNLQDTVYEPKVSGMLKNYINKNSLQKYKQLERSHKNIWPIPERLVSTNELLVAMARQANNGEER